MKKSILFSMAVAALVLAFVLPNVYAVDPPADDYMIPKPEAAETKMNSLPFPHSVHADYDCTECHHEGEVSQSCTDAGCHDLFVPEEPAQRRDIAYYEKAYHDQCLGCHRELKKEQAPTGPVACTGCHPKE